MHKCECIFFLHDMYFFMLSFYLHQPPNQKNRSHLLIMMEVFKSLITPAEVSVNVRGFHGLPLSKKLLSHKIMTELNSYNTLQQTG